MRYDFFQAKAFLCFYRHEDAISDAGRERFVNFRCRQFDGGDPQCFTHQAAYAAGHTDLLTAEIIEAVERCFGLDDGWTVRRQADQGYTPVLVSLGQVFLVHSPVRNGGGLGAGAEIWHFDSLRRNVTGVIAVKNPGGVSNTVSNQFKLLER